MTLDLTPGNPMSDKFIDDDPIVRELLPGYLARRHEELPQLEAALDAGDFETLRTTGHNLHGSGGAYGLPRISELGKQLERAARDGNGEQARVTLEEMRVFLNDL